MTFAESRAINASLVFQGASKEAKVDLMKRRETDGAVKLRTDMENARFDNVKHWLRIDFNLTKSIPRKKLADLWNRYYPNFPVTSEQIDDLIVELDNK